MKPQDEAKQFAATALATINAELEALDGWTIESAEDSEFAGEMLRDVKARHKALEVKRKTITKPLNAATKAVNDLFRAPRETLERAEGILKHKIAGYVEARALANNAAVDAASAAETPEQAATALANMQPDASPPAGVSVRYKWRAEVFSPGIVPDDFRIPDEAAIQAYTDEAVKLHGEPTQIPGVRFHKDPIVSSRKVKA